MSGKPEVRIVSSKEIRRHPVLSLSAGDYLTFEVTSRKESLDEVEMPARTERIRLRERTVREMDGSPPLLEPGS